MCLPAYVEERYLLAMCEVDVLAPWAMRFMRPPAMLVFCRYEKYFFFGKKRTGGKKKMPTAMGRATKFAPGSVEVASRVLGTGV